MPHLTGLDGLRGLALAGVLLFHADGALTGGYLGVDLFFVLSGYLITALLLKERKDTGRIDLRAFWVRRFRRLMPALLALMPAIALYARFCARPEDQLTLRNEAIASLGYFANWYSIFADRSYWQLFAAPSPLEHTWSLSIEEQFYLVWPLLTMLVLARFKPRAVLVLSLVLALGSVAAMLLIFSEGNSSRAYLGTDTRMAAILFGAAFAVVLPPGTELSPARTRQLDWLGLAAAAGLGFAWWTLDGTDPFLYRGGFWLTEAAVLVLIACAVTDKRSLVARALSFRPLTFLGTISYGVYLWHWPVNVFLTSERTDLEGVRLQVVRLGVTFAIALVSYHLLEKPIRQRGFTYVQSHLTLPVVAALACFFIVRPTDASAEPVANLLNVDTRGRSEPSSDLARYRVVVFGDSTANSLGWGLRSLRAKGLEVLLLGKDGCHMLSDNCDAQHWADKVRELRADATLVYVGGAFLHGFSTSGKWRTACHADWNAKFERNLTQRLRELEATDRRVFAVTVPYPEGRWSKPQYRDQVDCINTSIRKAAATTPAIRLIELPEHLCPKGTCRKELHDKTVIRPDGVHFSLAGAQDTAGWVIDRVRRP